MKQQLNSQDQFNLLALIPLMVLIIVTFPAAAEGLENLKDIINEGFQQLMFSLDHFKKPELP